MKEVTMVNKKFLCVLGSLLAAPLWAGQATGKFDYKPVNGGQEIHVESDHVVVSHIDFKFESSSIGGPLRQSNSNIEVRADNNGTVDQAIGVAVVLYDDQGNIVGAGNGGTHVGWLSKGERDMSKISLSYVYRNLDKAKTFVVTLETREKPKS
jgi:hypothetical protein